MHSNPISSFLQTITTGQGSLVEETLDELEGLTPRVCFLIFTTRPHATNSIVDGLFLDEYIDILT